MPTKTMKRHLKALERVFEAEINVRPFQSKAHVYKELEADGCVEFKTYTLGGGLPVQVEEIVLTHRGRIIYCQSCEGKED